MSCGGSRAKGSNHASATRKGAPGQLMSYRLLLRENPVDPGEAFRCYGRCQDRPSPKSYLDCLSECPGFAVDVACDEHDVPPVAACVGVRIDDRTPDRRAGARAAVTRPPAEIPVIEVTRVRSRAPSGRAAQSAVDALRRPVLAGSQRP